MLAAGPFGLGIPELLVILVILVLLFGATRLVDIGGSLGRGIREFRQNVREPADEQEEQAVDQPPAPNPHPQAQTPAASTRHCSSCNAQLNPEAKFCAECGAATQAGVK